MSADLVNRYAHLASEQREGRRQEWAERRFVPPLGEQIEDGLLHAAAAERLSTDFAR